MNDGSNLEILQDISVMTGSKLCSLEDIRDSEIKENIMIEELFGSCRKIRISEFECNLIGVQGEQNEIDNIRYGLEKRIKDEGEKNIKNYLQERLSRLQGRSCTIFVGGVTEAELSEERDKIVDCLNSCKTALETGILPGGGAAFAHGLKVLEELKFHNKDLNVGVNIFYKSIIVSYN